MIITLPFSEGRNIVSVGKESVGGSDRSVLPTKLAAPITLPLIFPLASTAIKLFTGCGLGFSHRLRV